MFCPECGAEGKAFVIDSRPTLDGIRRKRKCECGARFHTIEILDPDETKKRLECVRCHKVSVVPIRRKKYCDECQKEVVEETWRRGNEKRKEKKRKSQLPKLEVEAQQKGLSYGYLKGLEYLESLKEKENEV